MSSPRIGQKVQVMLVDDEDRDVEMEARVVGKFYAKQPPRSIAAYVVELADGRRLIVDPEDTKE